MFFNKYIQLMEPEKYTDNTIMLSGDYKYTSLCRVPPSYLLKIYHRRKKHPDKALLAYIKDNMEKIKGRQDGTIAIPKLEIACEKRQFTNQKEAKDEIKRIRDLAQGHKKPVRSYECEKCGAWHITSMSLEKWEVWKKNNLK